MASGNLTVHGPLYDININKVLVVAHAAGVKVHHNVITEPSKAKEALKLSPIGCLPVLETKDGAIFESNAICRYLARLAPSSGLYGSNEFEAAQIEQWIDFTTTCLAPPVIQLAQTVYGNRESNPEIEKEANSHLTAALKALEDKLKQGAHLVGTKTTLADLITAVTLTDVFRLLVSDKLAKKSFASVVAFFAAVSGQPAFKEIVGTVKSCSQEWHAPKIKHEEKGAKEEKKKDEKPAKEDKGGKKEEKPAAKKDDKPAAKEEKKKDEKKKEEKKPAGDDEGEEKEKKEKNPLDELPPSPFSLFDFKTLFVNAENKKDAMKFFWENFDNEGYSIWFMHYQKVAGEFSKMFQVSNFSEGFLQKVESLRKYAFAVHGVYGKEGDWEVRGCWVWRGQGHPNDLKEQGNYEYHTITRADPKKAEDRAKVEEYWCNMKPGTVVDGLPVVDVSYFK